MENLKILNLYCGIGGNRKLWPQSKITAIELNPEIARCYEDNFPNDKVIIGDAHAYLLEHFTEFDFIWASPPCPSHSRLNNVQASIGCKMKYPDLKLYEEIIFLQHWFKGKYCIENVIPYYEPLIQGQQLERHIFWTNFDIPSKLFGKKKLNHNESKAEYLGEFLGYNLKDYKISDKRLALRNCVLPELGLHVLNSAYRFMQPEQEQLTMF